MLAPGTRAVSSPGLCESSGRPAEEESPAPPEEGKVFSLDEAWGDLEAEWGQEEEEDRARMGPPEEEARAARRARAGRRERAAARGEAQEGEAVLGEDGADHH